MRILAVDHGEKRIGLAISDPTGSIARPLQVIQHTARRSDAAHVAEIAAQYGVELIVVGQSFLEDGRPSPAGRRAARFAEALRSQTQTPVLMWDEAFSTQDAQRTCRELGRARRKRTGHLDDLAAAMILQSYLDAQRATPRATPEREER